MHTATADDNEVICRLLAQLLEPSQAVTVTGLPRRNHREAERMPAPEIMHATAIRSSAERQVCPPSEPQARIDDTPSSRKLRALPGVADTAAAIAHGELKAGDCVTGCLEACTQAESLNAFVRLDPEGALSAAERLDTARRQGQPLPPLAGVPIGHKDIIFTRDLETEAGSRLLAGFTPTLDATTVRDLATAGTISLGKLNTHEFATGVTGTVSAAGPTLNPWDPERIPGGSSAGSAAAVAAGLVAAATGTDTGGSIRIPAACCGVVGLKPTYGLVSTRGVIPFAPSLDHVGPIARTIADVGAVFTHMSRSTEGPGSAPYRTRPGSLRGLRVGALRALIERATPAVARSVDRVGETLRQAGALCTDVEVPAAWAAINAAAVAIFLWEGGSYHRRALQQHPDLYQQPTRRFLEHAHLVQEHHYRAALLVRRHVAAQTMALLRQVDVLLLPTLPTRAPRCDADTVALPEGRVDMRAAMTRYTRPFNLTGLPALTLPCGLVEGMPVGAQLVGPWFQELKLLAVAGVVEQALGPLRLRAAADLGTQ